MAGFTGREREGAGGGWAGECVSLVEVWGGMVCVGASCGDAVSLNNIFLPRVMCYVIIRSAIPARLCGCEGGRVVVNWCFW